MNIFIYGVPGSGKTYYSKLFAKEHNLKAFEADTLRKIAQQDKPQSQYPFLYVGTCQAYKLFGDLNKEHATQGLLAVREALRDVVEDKTKQLEGYIIEGAFLDPLHVSAFGIPKLLVTLDEARHKRQFYRHREKLLDVYGNEFRSARFNQEFLIQEAQELGIEIIYNNN